MTALQFYGHGVPGYEGEDLPGKLIVLEGTDGVGRSTQIALLREWLEAEGYAVSETGLKRSKLAGKGLKDAMRGHTLGDTTMNLFYATDFADRLENEIIPALWASFVVLIDRYIYSILARAQVRGADPAWMRSILGIALIPDVVFYLQADISNLVPRVLNVRSFDYWESGMDFLAGRDYYDSYIEYQTRLLAQFDAIADEYDMLRVDANRGVLDVFLTLQSRIAELITDMKVKKTGENEQLKLAVNGGKNLDEQEKSAQPKSSKKEKSE